MKRSILLCCVILLTVVNAISATVINAELTLRKVDVTVTDTNNCQTPTIQLLDADKSEVLYSDEGSNENASYIFESFLLPMDAPSGNYILRIGENGTISELQLKYTSYSDAVDVLEKIKQSSSTFFSQMESYPELFGAKKEDLLLLDDDWKKRIEKEISALDIKYSDEKEATSTVKQISDIVKRIFDWARLINSEKTSEIEKAIQSNSNLDLTYIEKIASVSELNAGFKAQQIDKLNIDEKGISDAFDGALLVAVINENDWGTGKAVLNYYVNKGLINIDSVYLSSGADVYKALKDKKILDYKRLPEELQSINESNVSGLTGDGSSTGGKQTNSVSRVASSVIPVQASTDFTTTFSDLDEAKWAETAIEYLASKKIVSGRGNGIFAPNSEMTRAEFVKIAVDAFDLKDGLAVIDFEDVPKNEWYYIYIASAKKAGIIYGISDTYFGTNEYISRQDMAIIMLRIAEIKKINTSNTSGEKIIFSDSETISAYAKNAVDRLTAAGILNGMADSTFLPHKYVTRAEAAQVVYTMLCRKG